jgi:hypothetical protein
MASTLKHLRSSTTNKRPTASGLSDGQIAINTASATPGIFVKNSAGAIVKIGPTHVGATAPNASPAGSAGNSLGEQWLDTAGGRFVLKIWDGAAWRTQDGEFVNASGDTMTGALIMDNQQPVRFRETTANGTNFIALQAPASVTSDKTITLPDVTGTVVTTGDTGSVTSTMIANGTILDADVNASAAIAGTKISPNFGSQNVVTTGTSTAASLIPTGSSVPTNGVYLPSANTVGVATNGAGRLFVNSSGNVGIGTAAPTSLLHVDNGNITASRYADGNALLFLRAEGTQASPAAVSSSVGISNITSRGYDGTNYRELSSIQTVSDGAITSTSSPGFVRIATTPSSSTTPLERLRITSAGLVGIGTSAPGDLLTVSTAGGSHRIRIERSGTTVSTGQDCGGIAFYTNDSDNPNLKTWDVYQVSRGSIGLTDFYVNEGATNRFLIQHSTGNVGIGTTSPSNLLDVEGSIGYNNRLLAKSASGDGTALDPSICVGFDFDNGFFRPASNTIGISTGGSERARIDSSGRLLVGTSTSRASAGLTGQIQIEGTTASSSTLSIYANTNDSLCSFLTLAKSRGTSVGSNTVVIADDRLGEIRFGGADGLNAGSVIGASITAFVDGTPGANDMPGRLVFSTTADGASSPTERLRITSAGRVGLGTTTPMAPLHVEGETRVRSGNTGDSVIKIGTDATADRPSYIDLIGDTTYTSYGLRVIRNGGANGSSRLLHRGTGECQITTQEAAPITFQTAGTTRVQVTSAGRVGIGTTAPATALEVNGTIRTDTGAGHLEMTHSGTNGIINNNTGNLQIQAEGNQEVLLFTNGTQRFRVAGDGTAHIGASFGSAQLNIREAALTNIILHADTTQAQGTGWYSFYSTSNTNTTVQAWIRGDGTYGSRANVYGATSDIKLKENIANAGSQWDDIKAIEVKNFNLIGDDQRQIGVIAQQVEEVSPGLVDETVDLDEHGQELGTTTKIVKYSVLYMKAVKALQEAMERIEDLESRLAAAGI